MAKQFIPTDPRDLGRRLLQSGLVKSTGHASDLAHGYRSPSYALAIKLQEALGIPPSHWASIKRDRPTRQSEAA